MKRKCFYPLVVLLTIVFASCSESDAPGKYDNWRERNEAFIDSLQEVIDLKVDPELKSLVYPRDKKYKIYYKVINKEPEGQPPFYTSTVRYYYREMLIDEAVFGASSSPKYYTKLYNNLDVIKTNMKEADPGEFDTPKQFDVNKFDTTNDEVTGYSEIFQYMKIGERWEVYIPWQLAYGADGAKTTIGYSTVISDITLKSVDY